MLYKSCPHCKTSQEVGNFGKHRGMPDGLQVWCKRCKSKYNKNYPHTPEYMKAYGEKHRQYRLNRAYNQRCREKVKVLTYYGSRSDKPCCVTCGEERLDCLSIDHISGGGTEHRQRIGGHIYTWLIKNLFPTGYQTLCMNCQFIKKLGSQKEKDID